MPAQTQSAIAAKNLPNFDAPSDPD